MGCSTNYVTTWKPPPMTLSLLQAKFRKCDSYGKGPYLISSYPQPPKKYFLARSFTCSQAEINSPTLPHFFAIEFNNILKMGNIEMRT